MLGKGELEKAHLSATSLASEPWLLPVRSFIELVAILAEPWEDYQSEGKGVCEIVVGSCRGRMSFARKIPVNSVRLMLHVLSQAFPPPASRFRRRQ